MSRIAFGVGCFHFGIKKRPPYQVDAQMYGQWLSAALEGIPNIDNVTLDVEDMPGPASEAITITDEVPPIGDGGPPFPYYLPQDIAFSVHIPSRMQAELLGYERGTVIIPAEAYRVAMRRSYQLPVAFVEPLSPTTDDYDPSDAVILVRKFLFRHFDRPEEQNIRFEVLGPSPFHADFDLSPGGSGTLPFEFRKATQRAYDDLKFQWNGALFGDSMAARAALYAELAHELGVFYEIERLRSLRMGHWEAVEKAARQVVEIQRLRGLKGARDRFRWSGAILNDAVLALFDYQVIESQSRNQIQDAVRSEDGSRQNRYLKDYVDDAVTEAMVREPVAELSSLLNWYEARRAKRVDAVALIGSGVLGGAVGAMLTWLVGLHTAP